MDIKKRNTAEYAKLSIEETFTLLGSGPQGLSGAEAAGRLARYGYNELTEKSENLLLKFLGRYWGPMPWLLELAMALSFFLKHNLEAWLIFTLLTVNAVIGQAHERSSRAAIKLLKKKLAINVKVLRDGAWALKASREAAPGDVISVKMGDIIPADAKIMSGDLTADVSALTGESLPSELKAGGIAYSGSVVKSGEARCVVVNTGTGTYFGQTAELVKTAAPASHQAEVMMSVVRYMMYLGLAASALVSGYALFTHAALPVILTFVVIFLMGAVPVALPAVLTIVQSVGAMELSRQGALVTRLDSIEDAASIDLICFDKTGTITQNKLAVADSVPFNGYTKEQVAALGAMACREENLDVIDMAVLEYARGLGSALDGYKQLSFTPFTPAAKRTEAEAEYKGARLRVIKGAPQVVLGLCPGTDAATAGAAAAAVEGFAAKGYRTLAVAATAGNGGALRLAGFLPLSDPLRPDSKAMIAEARKLGIRPMMLTGDSLLIAREIARQAGIPGEIMRLPEFEALPAAEQARLSGELGGFAEIYPEDKYKIVKLFQARGHMVGMTGDGMNDAPALKQAELGIAVSNSADVAKAAASVVLTEPGLGVIIDAVKISRRTYQRMLSWVINKVTKVIEFVGLLTVAFFWLDGVVLSLLGMALLVFANDFVTMSLATDNADYTGSPNKWDVKNITLSALVPGLLLVVEGLLVILAGKNLFRLDWEPLRALVLLNLIFNSQFRVLIVRERRHFWASLPGRDLAVLSGATIAIFLLLGISGVFMPALPLRQVFAVLGFSMVFTLAIDFPKVYMFRKFGL